MISVEEAFEQLDEHVGPLSTTRVSILEARNRVASREITSRIDIPPYRQSAMDGYAVRSADVQHAADTNPAVLQVVGERAAGDDDELSLESGEAIRIFTGASVPPDADAVIMQEKVDAQNGEIAVFSPVDPGNNIRPPGEGLSRGWPLVGDGQRIDDLHVAACVCGGVDETSVVRKPTIAVLITGDELVSITERRRPDQLYDTNGPFLSNWLAHRGYPSAEVRHVPDDMDAVTDALQAAFDRCDLVVTSGGVSVGDHDYVVRAAESVGVDRVFWKVRQKPGKPVYFGMHGETPFLGLPGNPGAVFTCTNAYLRRMIDLREGVTNPQPRFHTAAASEPIERRENKAVWLGGQIEDTGTGVRIFFGQTGPQTHRITDLFQADALARVSAGRGSIERGDRVLWVSCR